MSNDLRMKLRQQTRVEHDELDRLLSDLNLSSCTGLTLFSQLHLSCFTTIEAAVTSDCRSKLPLGYMIIRLKRDLNILGGLPIARDPGQIKKLDPLAIDYIVAGSRLGSKVLKRRWMRSDDLRVRSASHYFGQEDDMKLWPDTCAALSAVPTNSSRAATIIADTKLLFGIFSDTYHYLTAEREMAL